MMVFVLALIVFVIAVLGLAAGVVMRGRPLRGSCGGCANCLVNPSHDDSHECGTGR